MQNCLRIFLNGQPIQVNGSDALLTLSDFLRKRMRLTGTKVVCAEGDCGSCTALVGRLVDGTIVYRTVTSCIISMHQLNATHVISIEGLLDEGELNPIQQSMVKCHGAQCGFCTPGIVVSLFSLMENPKNQCNACEVRRALSGNLCRCTGYDSIIRAALETDRSSVRSIESRFPSITIAPKLSEWSKQDVLIQSDDVRIFRPASLSSALEHRSRHPDALIVSGATDVGVLLNKAKLSSRDVLSVNEIPDLRGVKVSNDVIDVGAAASITQLQDALQQTIPPFYEYLELFGSLQIRNAGAVASNLVTASPIGDLAPPLFVLGATIELVSVDGKRELPLEQFHVGYRKTALKPNEIVTRVKIPFPSSDQKLWIHKVSRRRDLDISTFSAAILSRLENDRIADIKIALGGVAATVVRAIEAENHLIGHEPTLERFEQAGKLASDQLKPLTDVRGSARYRSLLIKNIFTKFWHEVASPVEA